MEGASDETKALIDALFEVIAREGSDPLIVYIRDVENWILNNFEAYTSFKERIERVKGRVLVMTSYISKVGGRQVLVPLLFWKSIRLLMDNRGRLHGPGLSSRMEGVFAVRGESADRLSVEGLFSLRSVELCWVWVQAHFKPSGKILQLPVIHLRLLHLSSLNLAHQFSESRRSNQCKKVEAVSRGCFQYCSQLVRQPRGSSASKMMYKLAHPRSPNHETLRSATHTRGQRSRIPTAGNGDREPARFFCSCPYYLRPLM